MNIFDQTSCTSYTLNIYPRQNTPCNTTVYKYDYRLIERNHRNGPSAIKSFFILLFFSHGKLFKTLRPGTALSLTGSTNTSGGATSAISPTPTNGQEQKKSELIMKDGGSKGYSRSS